jgi:hypothetical protein
MKLLITGATGLIGKNIMAKAQKKNITIHFLSTQKNKLIDSDGVKGFYWNPLKGEIDGRCFEGVDTLVHLAGASISKSWTTKNKKEILDSRVSTSRLLRKEMKQQNIKMNNILCASAIGIYPNSFELNFDEKSEIEEKNFLQKVTIAWEKESAAMDSFAGHLCILRIGLVLAKDEGLLSLLTIPFRLFLGTAFASGKQWQSWIHIEDLSQLFITAANQNWEGTFNAVAPNPVSQRTMMKAIGKVLHSPVFLPNIPAFLIKTVMGERSILILGSQKVRANLILSKGFSFQFSLLPEALRNIFKKKE